MYYNNNLNFNGGNPYVPRQPLPNATTLLTQEEFNVLANNNSALSLNFSPEDLLKCRCVHRYQNGVMAIEKVASSTGVERAKCKICGKEFDMVNIEDAESVKNIVDNFSNLSECVKAFYMDIPPVMGKFFEYIPITEKLPLVANEAAKSYHKYASVANNQQMYGNGIRGQYNSIMNGSVNPYAYNMNMQMQQYPQQMNYGYMNGVPNQMYPVGGVMQQPQPYGVDPYAQYIQQQQVNPNAYSVQQYPQQQQVVQNGYVVSQPQVIPNGQNNQYINGGMPNQGLNPNDIRQQPSQLVNGSSVQIDPVTGKQIESSIKL